MARIGLSIYLMLMTLAGPVLCPCSMPQLFAPSAPSSADASRDIVRRCPCCPKLPATSTNIPKDDRGERPSPAQAPCRCPSHGHGVVDLLPQRVQHSGAALSDLLDGLQLDVLFRRADFTSLRVIKAVSAPFSSSPTDRLHVLCLLRC